MKKVLLLFIIITVTISCTTTKVVDYYKPIQPWSDIRGFYTFDKITPFVATNENKLVEVEQTVSIMPVSNAYIFYSKALLYEYQMELYEIDFPVFKGYLEKFSQWYDQAKEMDVELNKEIGEFTTLYQYRWTGKSEYNTCKGKMELSFITTVDNDYLLSIYIEELKPIGADSNYFGTLNDIRYFLTIDDVQKIIGWLGKDKITMLVDEAIENDNLIKQSVAEENEKQDKQKEIESTFN